MVERELQHFDEAAKAFGRATQLDPHNTNGEFLLGQTLLKLGRKPEAIAALKKTVEIDPSYSQAYYSLSRALAKTNPEDATLYLKRYEDAQRQDRSTERALTLSNFALQAERAGDTKGAVAQLQEAIQVCGECASLALLHKNLGLIECRAGQLEDGEKELRVALQSLPNDAEILQSLKVLGELRQKASSR